MKEQIISAIRTFLRDRYLTVLLAVFMLLGLILVVLIAVSLHPSELQVVVHYTSYGITNFYRDKWYYLISFAAYVVMMTIIHCILTYKLLQSKGRSFAIAFVWLGFIILAVSAVLFYQVLKIASLS